MIINRASRDFIDCVERMSSQELQCLHDVLIDGSIKQYQQNKLFLKDFESCYLLLVFISEIYKLRTGGTLSKSMEPLDFQGIKMLCRESTS